MAAAENRLARDPTAEIAHHRPDDRFIPFRPSELATALMADTAQFGPDAALLGPVADAIDHIREQEATAFERELAGRYAAFNPDRDTIPLGNLNEARTPDRYAELAARLDYLLNKANFERLDDVQIEAAIHAAKSSGLCVKLDPTRVEQLAVWVRGRTEAERCFRTWRKPVKGEPRRMEVYRRLVVVSRLRGDPSVRVKMFKEIPVADLEALLPHARVRMNWIDRIKLMGGGAGMVGSTAMKLTAALAFSRLLWVVTGAFAMLLFRTFTGYRSVRTQRDLQRTTHLYYQNLSNNAGAIHLLIALVTQEEIKETLLAYAFLHAAEPPILSPDDLMQRVEAYFTEKFGVQFDFDVDDALESLDSLELWADRARLRVKPPAEVAEQLQRHWQQRRSAEYHESVVRRNQVTGAL